jgi:hypothetical protein
MGDLYDKTMEKQRYFEKEGYKYQSIWESDFDQECIENDDMRRFIEKLDMVTPLVPRDAFYGGRTEAYTLYKEASLDEDIDYYDVTSLYPYVNKTGKIPAGHPTIITENFKSLEKYEGLVKCKILPPRKLFHPLYCLVEPMANSYFIPARHGPNCNNKHLVNTKMRTELL